VFFAFSLPLFLVIATNRLQQNTIQKQRERVDYTIENFVVHTQIFRGLLISYCDIKMQAIYAEVRE